VPKARTSLFNVEEFLNSHDGGRSVSNYGKDRKVFSRGDPADAVFYIQEGKVKVSVISERGKEAVVALHGKGDFFGEGCLTGQRLRLSTVSAMTDCVITRIDKAIMVATLRDEPKLSELFMAYLLVHSARVEEDLVDQLFNSSEKRLARILLLLANVGKEAKPEPSGVHGDDSRTTQGAKALVRACLNVMLARRPCRGGGRPRFIPTLIGAIPAAARRRPNI
jgi:CRP/FNR family transcriptional regulator, cyclic AMP receptor protein